VEFVASLSQGRTAAAQCGLFTYKSVPVIFEPPCTTPLGVVAPGEKENPIGYIQQFVLDIRANRGLMHIDLYINTPSHRYTDSS